MWTIRIYGGDATASICYRFAEEPEHREVEELLLKHGATRADVANKA